MYACILQLDTEPEIALHDGEFSDIEKNVDIDKWNNGVSKEPFRRRIRSRT